jgi:DNA-binding PucR family transcriptional regulator
MGNLTNALQELRAERSRAQSQVQKLDQAISVIESLNGSGSSQKTNQPTRVISAASRRKMAQGQKARWAKVRKESEPVEGAAKTKGSAPAKPKHTMSAAARKKIGAAVRARWVKIKAGQKKAA